MRPECFEFKVLTCSASALAQALRNGALAQEIHGAAAAGNPHRRPSFPAACLPACGWRGVERPNRCRARSADPLPTHRALQARNVFGADAARCDFHVRRDASALDRAASRRVIARGGEAQRAVTAALQRDHGLHRALAERVVPTISARLRSCSAPATISAAEAEAPLISTTTGTPARSSPRRAL
jgi:hypothetical protein